MAKTAFESFWRYCKRFFVAFWSSASWGRDQLIGGVVFLLVLIYQLWWGRLDEFLSGQGDALKWSVLKPYLYVLGGYVLVHGFLTAWRLDRAREAEIGLPLVVEAGFEDDNTDTSSLILRVRNKGPKDRFSVRIVNVIGFEERFGGVLIPQSVRWRDQPNSDVVLLDEGSTRFIELLRIPLGFGESQGGNGVPKAIVCGSNGESNAYFRWDCIGSAVDAMSFTLQFRALDSGQDKWLRFLVHPGVCNNQKLVLHVFGESHYGY